MSGIVCLRAFTACRLGCPRDKVNHLCQACPFHSDCCHQVPLLLLSPSTPHPTNTQVPEKTLSQLLHVPHLSIHPKFGLPFIPHLHYNSLQVGLPPIFPLSSSVLYTVLHSQPAVLGARVRAISSTLQMRKQGSESESTCPSNIFRRQI